MRYLWRIVLGLVSIGLAIALLWCVLPTPARLVSPVETATLLDCRGREIAILANSEARIALPLRLGHMGPWLPAITVALEDHRFYQHAGFDWRANAAAAIRNLRTGRIISGASTITQQLIKLSTGRAHRTWSAKIRETLLATKLERTWSKDRVLAEYLNRSSYGNRRIGPEAAARSYFNKSARDLTLNESVFLAGLPQAPTRLNPWRHLDRAMDKYQRSLTRLAELKVITPEQRTLLAQSPPKIGRFDPPRLARHFVDALVATRLPLRGRVNTTLDLDLQTSAERYVRVHLDTMNRNDITQAALVIVENNTGAVRAMVGSSDYSASEVNGATRPRSCGSTLKPFVYLAAIDQRVLTAATILPDTPDAIRGEYADYDPQNYNHHYLGPVRLREALACSLNVPAVFALSKIGARPAFYELQRWGFQFPRALSDYGAGFILGNAEIRLVDLAAAYAGLARGGVAAPAKYLAAQHGPMPRLASPEATAIITDILCDNGARERSFGTHSPLAFEERIAAKTGTSSGFRDAWTVGFNKRHTVAVWTGNFNGRPMRDTLAIRSATPLWSNIMHGLLPGDGAVDAAVPNDKLRRREICAATGLLPLAATITTENELFLTGTEPRESAAALMTEDGSHLLLPNEYASWVASNDNDIGAVVRSDARITNPTANATYAIDSILSPVQQMLELKATLGSDAEWFVNDVPQKPRADGRVFWQLEPGKWTVRASSRFGAAESTITVN